MKSTVVLHGAALAIMLAWPLGCGGADEGGERGSSSEGAQEGGSGGSDGGRGGSDTGSGGSDDASSGEVGSDDGCDGCDAHASCEGSGASAACVCDEGYEGDGESCADVDECADDLDNCDPNATCTNTEGGFECACEDGYEGDGEACADVDECAGGSDDCDDNATCTNNAGGFVCECKQGFDGDGTSCISSCDQALGDTCADNGLCEFRGDGIQCRCPAGTEDVNGDGSECAPGDERCAEQCDRVAVCTVDGDGVNCACPQGYEDVNGDGSECADVDECEAGTHTCHERATCTNNIGGFSCDCNSGFSGSGVSCSDVDECAEGLDDCHAEATCSNTNGSFECACNSGFEGAGTVCRDVDECAMGVCDDDPNATGCQNTAGGYECDCATGATWNGSECELQFCDLSGTWAVRVETYLDFDPVVVMFDNMADWTVIEGSPSGGLLQTTWDLRTLEYDGETLTMTSRPCGATEGDVCAPLGAPQDSGLQPEVYGNATQFGIYDDPSREFTPTVHSFPLPDAAPGTEFTSPDLLTLSGIQLDDPWGEWPQTAQETCPSDGSPSTTGRACIEGWPDDDDDGFPGVTIRSRSPSQTPARTSCGGMEITGYSYPPTHDEVPSTRRLGCGFTGARLIAKLSGTVDNCDVLSGDIIDTELKVRVAGCKQAPVGDLGACGDLSDCTASDIEFLDTQDQTQTINRANFVMLRVTDPDISCSEVRELDYSVP